MGKAKRRRDRRTFFCGSNSGSKPPICSPDADSDEAAPLFRDDCAPGFRDDLAPWGWGLPAVTVVSSFAW
ncbi:hypothetical protein EHS39_35370 [Ensifer sp. MPMI2T]|nr:hypothetical protein EHS39_35370 [Ensifer sp. MPMI2T]